jgi:hypothetical protein
MSSPPAMRSLMDGRGVKRTSAASASVSSMVMGGPCQRYMQRLRTTPLGVREIQNRTPEPVLARYHTPVCMDLRPHTRRKPWSQSGISADIAGKVSGRTTHVESYHSKVEWYHETLSGIASTRPFIHNATKSCEELPANDTAAELAAGIGKGFFGQTLLAPSAPRHRQLLSNLVYCARVVEQLQESLREPSHPDCAGNRRGL